MQQLKIHEDRLAEWTAQLAATRVHAPTGGMVVYGSTISRSHRDDDDSISKGTKVYFNQTLIVLPDTSRMAASVLVHEAMIASVKEGDKVNVMVDALQGKILEGVVSKVDQSAEDGGWWNRDLRQYRVRVDLEGKDIGQLKPAMRCVARIITDRVQGALAVPIQAVHSERRQKFCYLPVPGGKVRRQPVKIGRSSETLVEIVSGLEEGDRVLLRRPRPGEEVVQ